MFELESKPNKLNEENAENVIDLQMDANQNKKEQTELVVNEHSHKTYLSFKWLLFRVLNLCFSSFYFGYCLAYFGTFQFKTIAGVFGIEKNLSTYEGLLQGCIPVGGGIGALGSSIILKKFSRRNSLLFVNMVAFITGILLLIPNYKLLFLARLVQGMCVGLYSALIPLLIKEYTPIQLSGTFGAFHQALIAFGVFFAYVFQWILLQISEQEHHWRTIFGLTEITIAIQTIVLIFMFRQQTPKYLLLQNREPECLEYLKKIHKAEYIEKILAQKKADIEQTSDSSEQSARIQQTNSQGKKLRIILAIHLAVLQQMIGVNSVVAYGTEIAAETAQSLTRVIPVLLNGIQIVAALISSYLLSKRGRVVILNFGTLVAALSLTLIAVGFMIKNATPKLGTAFIMIGLFVFMFNFGLSLGPVVWLYIAEIVQPEIIPFSTLSNWIAASLVVITFPILTKAFGTPVPLFIFFAIWSYVSLFMNRKWLVETKGKTEKQIHEEFSKK